MWRPDAYCRGFKVDAYFSFASCIQQFYTAKLTMIKDDSIVIKCAIIKFPYTILSFYRARSKQPFTVAKRRIGLSQSKRRRPWIGSSG